MRRLLLFYAILSGLHPGLALAELRGILEALGYRYRPVEVLDLLAVFSCSCSSSLGVAWRAGLVQSTGRLVAVAEADQRSILEALEPVDYCRLFPPGSRVKVVLRRLRGYARNSVPDSIARSVAGKLDVLLGPCGATASPREPSHVLEIVVSQGAAVIGVREDVKPDRLLESHRPTRRPFFHPGSLDPRLARLFVNLSRASPQGIYLDPFCGTAGFALEAQEMGIPTVCGELAGKLARGAKVNLWAYPGSPYTLTVAQWDAARLPLRDESVKSIGTDPPYGRSISLHGKPLENLLRDFLEEAARVLEPGGYLAYATPHWAEERAEEYMEQAGLKMLEKHYMKVHGTLTRIIIVARKPSGRARSSVRSPEIRRGSVVAEKHLAS